MFWTSIQGSAFLFFRIFTSPLNSLYLYSFGGLFFSGWKRNSFFPLSPPSWLSLSSPLSSPPLIHLLPLSSLNFPLFSSSPIHYCPISSSIFSSPHLPLIPISPWLSPLFQYPPSSSPPHCFPHPFLLWSSDSLSYYFLCSLHSSFTPLPNSSLTLLTFLIALCCILLYPSVCLLIFSGFHPLAMPPFALPLLSHSPSLPPPRPFTSQLLIQLSFLSQSDMSLNGAVENKILTKPRDLPASPFRLFIYSFVCVPLAPSPSPPSLQL